MKTIKELLKKIDQLLFPMFYTKDGKDIVEETKKAVKRLEDASEELKNSVSSLNDSVKKLEVSVEDHISNSEMS